jgi:hypothetical protein
VRQGIELLDPIEDFLLYLIGVCTEGGHEVS